MAAAAAPAALAADSVSTMRNDTKPSALLLLLLESKGPL
jgi:hypothetical protein